MNEQTQQGDVDKLLDEFLSELNALGSSLESARAERVSDNGDLAGGPEPQSPPAPAPAEERTPDAAVSARGASSEIAAPPVDSTPEKHPEAARYSRYRNIDILLMDDVERTPLRRKPDEYEFPYNYKTLYRSRFWFFRRRSFLAWSVAALALTCILGSIVYFRDPFGFIRKRAETTASPSERLPEKQAVAIDKIMPRYPSGARKRGIRGVVEVQAVVNGNGQVVRATPLSGPAQLRSAAAEAVERCRFKPATRGGVTVESTVTVPVRFDR